LNRHSFSARSWRRHQSWVIPRTAEDAALVDDVATDSAHLSDYGWSVSTGPLVWNRHRSQLADDPGQGRLPVIWAGDIRGGRVELEPGRSRRFVTPAPGQDWLVLDWPAVLVQRTTAPEQARRLVAGLLDEAALAELGGRVVVENHVNVCTWNGHGPLRPDSLVEYLTSERADRLYRCMTGSVAVSAFELRQLPLPSRPESVVSGADSEIRAA
jgi:adenine-specific DNA-methyltransferase